MRPIQRNIETNDANMCLRQLALRVRAEEQDSGIRESPVAGHGPDVAEQIMSRPVASPRPLSVVIVELLVRVARRWLAANGMVQAGRPGRSRPVSEYGRSEHFRYLRTDH